MERISLLYIVREHVFSIMYEIQSDGIVGSGMQNRLKIIFAKGLRRYVPHDQASACVCVCRCVSTRRETFAH